VRPREMFRSPRFWIPIGVLLVLAAFSAVIVHVAGPTWPTGALQFIPFWLVALPVLFVTITFGTAGVVSAAAATIITFIPWMLHAQTQVPPAGIRLYVIQIGVLILMTAVLGIGVDADTRARARTEEERLARLAAEDRYRNLFETNSEPLLIVDTGGTLQEGNDAAQALFGAASVQPGATTLAVLLGAPMAANLLDGRGTGDTVSLPLGAPTADGTLMRAAATPFEDMSGTTLLQVVLRDVTDDARKRQRMEAYAADVVRGQEDERRHIAQELHDGPLQSLVHLCRQIDEFSNPDGAVDVAELRQLTESVVAELRDISRGLRPPSLDDLGLVTVLQRLCDDTERKAGVAASLVVDAPGAPALDPGVELAVYRIAQEALSNVTRHAHASTVYVRLAIDRSLGALELVVTDDGEGFGDAPAGDRGDTGGNGAGTADGVPGVDSFGILGMTERAALVGGTISVRSIRNGGTTVECRIPVPAGAVGD
jgi:signal transduction histidine kinase